jgi:hypothetical protein
MGDNSPPAPASPANRRVVWLVSIAVVLVLTGGIWALTRSPSSGASGHASPQPTSTATPEPSRVVYASNWSHGSGGWDLPTSVQSKGGLLIFSGNGNANLTIPYLPSAATFTITMGMEIDAVNPVSNGGTVTIAGQDAGGNSLYYGQIDCVGRQFQGCSGGEIAAGTEGGTYPTGMGISDFDTGPYVNSYKLIVGASNVTFCYQASCEGAGYVNAPKHAVKLVLLVAYLELKVTSISVSIP